SCYSRVDTGGEPDAERRRRKHRGSSIDLGARHLRGRALQAATESLPESIRERLDDLCRFIVAVGAFTDHVHDQTPPLGCLFVGREQLGQREEERWNRAEAWRLPFHGVEERID